MRGRRVRSRCYRCGRKRELRPEWHPRLRQKTVACGDREGNDQQKYQRATERRNHHPTRTNELALAAGLCALFGAGALIGLHSDDRRAEVHLDLIEELGPGLELHRGRPGRVELHGLFRGQIVALGLGEAFTDGCGLTVRARSAEVCLEDELAVLAVVAVPGRVVE